MADEKKLNKKGNQKNDKTNRNPGKGSGNSKSKSKKGKKGKKSEGKAKFKTYVFNKEILENTYYTCHNIMDVLYCRGFQWPEMQKKKKKGKKH